MTPAEAAGPNDTRLPNDTLLPLGIPGLDTLLHGGLPPGNAVLVQGAPGTGKTILGMQFLQAGITQREQPGLFVTFEEPPQRLYRDAAALGWDFAGWERERRLQVVYTSPSVFLQELEAEYYTQLIRDLGLRRIVVDSLTQFETLPGEARDVRTRFQRIVNALRRDGLTILMTRELETRDPLSRVTPEEYIADTIVQLEYRLLGERRARLVEVLKHRGSGHSPAQHRFIIAPGGLQILAETNGGG